MLGARELLLMPLVSGDRAIGVLSIVSHDLRNPISAIAMCARTLQDAPPESADARTALLVTIQESTRWIDRLIQDLVDVANIERGQLSLSIDPQDASRIVLQARHLFEVEASQHGIALEVSLPTNLPLIAADGARLVQVLSNLLRNAIKFTPNGGRITLAAAPNATGGVTFSVRDTGAGIPAANLEHIFDRYWESSNGARTKGSGLGLSIARGIVQAHGGEITVRSVVGEGTEFMAAMPPARR
jgi:signal transduction histidine kinase